MNGKGIQMNRNDETRTARGSSGTERGVGCSGAGLPDVFNPEGSSLVEDYHAILGGGFSLNRTEEEDLGFAGPLKD